VPRGKLVACCRLVALHAEAEQLAPACDVINISSCSSVSSIQCWSWSLMAHRAHVLAKPFILFSSFSVFEALGRVSLSDSERTTHYTVATIIVECRRTATLKSGRSIPASSQVPSVETRWLTTNFSITTQSEIQLLHCIGLVDLLYYRNVYRNVLCTKLNYT